MAKWVPGQSGNPQGRPKNPFRELIVEKTGNGEELVEKVLKILRTSKKEQYRLWAAEWLADRAWGKPAQKIDGEITHRVIKVIRSLEESELTVLENEPKRIAG